MILSNKTKVKVSLSKDGKKYMYNNLNQRLNLLRGLVNETMQCPPDIRSNIEYTENLKSILIQQDSFEMPYIDFVTIFGGITSESVYIKDNKLEILEEDDG